MQANVPSNLRQYFYVTDGIISPTHDVYHFFSVRSILGPPKNSFLRHWLFVAIED